MALQKIVSAENLFPLWKTKSDPFPIGNGFPQNHGKVHSFYFFKNFPSGKAAAQNMKTFGAIEDFFHFPWLFREKAAAQSCHKRVII